jgi:hypothetical protein
MKPNNTYNNRHYGLYVSPAFCGKIKHIVSTLTCSVDTCCAYGTISIIKLIKNGSYYSIITYLKCDPVNRIIFAERKRNFR